MVGLNYFALFAWRIRIKLTSRWEDFEPREDQTQSEVAKWRTRTGRARLRARWIGSSLDSQNSQDEWKKNYDGVLFLAAFLRGLFLARGSGKNLIKISHGRRPCHIAAVHTRHPAANHADSFLFRSPAFRL